MATEDPNGVYVYISLYADATQIRSFGEGKFHPILARFGFIEDDLRRSDEYGGAILVGYMPVVSCFMVLLSPFCLLTKRHRFTHQKKRKRSRHSSIISEPFTTVSSSIF